MRRGGLPCVREMRTRRVRRKTCTGVRLIVAPSGVW